MPTDGVNNVFDPLRYLFIEHREHTFFSEMDVSDHVYLFNLAVRSGSTLINGKTY